MQLLPKLLELPKLLPRGKEEYVKNDSFLEPEEEGDQILIADLSKVKHVQHEAELLVRLVTMRALKRALWSCVLHNEYRMNWSADKRSPETAVLHNECRINWSADMCAAQRIQATLCGIEILH